MTPKSVRFFFSYKLHLQAVGTALQGVRILECASSVAVASTLTSEFAARRRAEFVHEVGRQLNTETKILRNRNNK